MTEQDQCLLSIFTGNFICECFTKSIIHKSCILGICVLLLSIILLILNIRAFIKMTKFYGKMNFENMIILLSIIQILILQLVLLFSYDILFELFFLFQIFIISLIIRKFINLAKEPKTFWQKNGLSLLINILNVLIFSIFPIYLYIFNEKGHHIFVKLIYRIFHVIITTILTYYCCFFIHYINNVRNNNTDPNSSKLIEEEQMFYSQKKKQITFLYIINLLCAFVQISFTIVRNFAFKKHYINSEYKTIPNREDVYAEIIYYLYLIICFFNIMVTFICFYFMIRHQYTEQENDNDFNKIKKESLLDQDYIDSENQKKNRDVTDFINDNEKTHIKRVDSFKYTDKFDVNSTKLLPDSL